MRGADIEQYLNAGGCVSNFAALGSVEHASCQHKHCRSPYKIWILWIKLQEGPKLACAEWTWLIKFIEIGFQCTL